MPITITPITTPEIPAIPPKAFDRLWIRRMIVDAPDPDSPVTVSVSFKIYRIDDNGKAEFYRNLEGTEPEIYLNIPNVFTLLTDDPADDAVIGVVLNSAQSIRDAITAQLGMPANGLALVEILTQALGHIAKEHGLVIF
jgi:hypothetical protein